MLFCEACENATHQPAVLMWAAGQAGFSFSRFSVRFAVKRVPTGIFARALRPADERVGRAWKETMLRLTDEELSRVQDLCRVLPPWKRSEFLQELARRMQSGTSETDLRREAATAMRAVLGRGHAWVPEPD